MYSLLCEQCIALTCLENIQKKKSLSQTVSQILSREYDTFLNQPSLPGFNWA